MRCLLLFLATTVEQISCVRGPDGPQSMHSSHRSVDSSSAHLSRGWKSRWNLHLWAFVLQRLMFSSLLVSELRGSKEPQEHLVPKETGLFLCLSLLLSVPQHSSWPHLDPQQAGRSPGSHPTAHPLLPLLTSLQVNLLLIPFLHIPGHQAYLSNLANAALSQAFPSPPGPGWLRLASEHHSAHVKKGLFSISVVLCFKAFYYVILSKSKIVITMPNMCYFTFKAYKALSCSCYLLILGKPEEGAIVTINFHLCVKSGVSGVS